MSASQLAQNLAGHSWTEECQRIAGLELKILVRVVGQAVAQDLSIVLEALKRQRSARSASMHDPTSIRQAPHVSDRLEKFLPGVACGLTLSLAFAHRPSASRYFSASSAAMHPLPALVTACR